MLLFHRLLQFVNSHLLKLTKPGLKTYLLAASLDNMHHRSFATAVTIQLHTSTDNPPNLHDPTTTKLLKD